MRNHKLLAVAALSVLAAISVTLPAKGDTHHYACGLGWYDGRTGASGFVGQYPLARRDNGTIEAGTLGQAWNAVLARGLTPYVRYETYVGSQRDVPPPRPQAFPGNPHWRDEGPVSISPGPGPVRVDEERRPTPRPNPRPASGDLVQLYKNAQAALNAYQTETNPANLEARYEAYIRAQEAFEQVRRRQASGGPRDYHNSY